MAALHSRGWLLKVYKVMSRTVVGERRARKWAYLQKRNFCLYKPLLTMRFTEKRSRPWTCVACKVLTTKMAQKLFLLQLTTYYWAKRNKIGSTTTPKIHCTALTSKWQSQSNKNCRHRCDWTEALAWETEADIPPQEFLRARFNQTLGLPNFKLLTFF